MQIDVSSPPEYAKTTVSLDGSAFAELATTADEDDVCEVHACEAHAWVELVEAFDEVVIVTSFLDGVVCVMEWSAVYVV